MRPILFVFLIFVTGTALSAQFTRKPVKVIDFGELYSTYSWEEAGAELRANLGDALADAVIAGSNESAWPAGISSLTGRTENRARMWAYKLYYLTTIKSTVAVLMAPVSENLGMPADMQTGKDIYFVIGLNGIDLKGGISPENNPDPVPAGDFAAQWNGIVEDFQNGFANLTGAQIDEDEDGLVILYESRASLDGALALYFIKDLLSATTAFHAEFSASTDPAVALESYRKLTVQVEGMKLSCCGLQKQPETVEGSVYEQKYTAYDPAGKMNIAFQSMVVQVRIEQGETFDKAGQLVSNWIPVLEIYEQ